MFYRLHKNSVATIKTATLKKPNFWWSPHGAGRLLFYLHIGHPLCGDFLSLIAL